MRGKLRDKRSSNKRDSYRDIQERRRPYKRDSRNMLRINQNANEDQFDEFDELEEEEVFEEEFEEINPKPRK